MNNEEVMQMMTDMGLHDGGMENWKTDNAWVDFANKVSEREREACAKLIEDIEIRKTTYSGWLMKVKKEYADAIRARGEK